MKLQKVKDLLRQEGLDAFLFSSQANVQYLTGFRSTHAYAIVALESNYLLTDARYYERAKDTKGWEVILITGPALKILKKFIKEKNLKNVGYEKDRVSCELARKLKSKGIKWRGFSGFLNKLRAVKTKEEISIMKEGVSISDKVYQNLLSFVKPGMKELEVRAFLIGEFLKHGALGESFPAIVASADASAVPHWETSNQSIIPNAPLLVDMGLVWKGYCTDFTRTIFLGKANQDFKKLYNIVKDAHLYALEAVKEGTPIGNVDKKARDYIEKKGFGKFFTHSTGHGVGIEIHEYPRVYYKGDDAKTLITEGMVFTIEPGIYIPGEFGVRLENIVVVEDGIGKPLSSVSLDLVEV